MSSEKSNLCSICFETMGNKRIVLKCGHSMHRICFAATPNSTPVICPKCHQKIGFLDLEIHSHHKCTKSCNSLCSGSEDKWSLD